MFQALKVCSFVGETKQDTLRHAVRSWIIYIVKLYACESRPIVSKCFINLSTPGATRAVNRKASKTSMPT